MEDNRIVELYWSRDEAAIAETQRKYGNYCFSIASRILQDPADAQEAVNDAYLGAWNAIPPHRPEALSAFLGKITRRVSLKKYRERTAIKRGGGSVEASLDELEECLPSGQSAEDALAVSELTALLNAFLDALPTDTRRVFLRRYWYFDPVREIAARYGYGESKVKMMLKRTRDELRAYLEKEEIGV